MWADHAQANAILDQSEMSTSSTGFQVTFRADVSAHIDQTRKFELRSCSVTLARSLSLHVAEVERKLAIAGS